MRVLAKGANLMLGHEMPHSARGFSCGAQISENDSDFQGAYFDMRVTLCENGGGWADI
jgi:hypothetical protein